MKRRNDLGCPKSADLNHGLRSKCRACNAVKSADWNKVHPEKHREVIERYRAKNIEKLRAKALARARSNPAKHNAAAARWRKENPEKKRAQKQKWETENRERYLAMRARRYRRDPEGAKRRVAEWQKKNPEAARMLRQNRRARQLQASGQVTASDLSAVLAGSLNLCSYCNAPCEVTADHIEPLARGGEHSAGNLAAACRPCNSSKNDTPLLLWLARRATVRKAA